MSFVSLPEVSVSREPTRRERSAVGVLQAGFLVAILIATTYRAFDLDRFFVPKEMVLHLTAAIAGFLLLGSVRRMTTTRVDLLLAAFLLAGMVSTLFATNAWSGTRAFAISVSGALVFWSARALAEAGLGRRVLLGIGAAAVAGAVTCLLQAYGVTTDFFSLSRSPGGTLGNRNFVAHLVAYSLPVLLFSALRAWRPLGYLIGSAASALGVWALILTRSRAAWLGLIVVLVVMAGGTLLCGPVRRNRRFLVRATVLALITAGGVAGAILLPNALQWRSETPYLETARGVVNYREGSGRGRLIQYGNSLAILRQDPLLGAGPGNWQVRYAEHAESGDPSLDRSQPGLTANPWPSSDWVALLAERGLVGFTLLVLTLAGLAVAAWRRLRSARDAEEGLGAATCLAVLAGTLTVGAFDAVLLLAWPTLLVSAAVGTLWSPSTAREIRAPGGVRSGIVLLLALAASAATIRSLGQVAAMGIYAGEPERADLERAALLDPGNLRVRISAARSYRRGEEGRCRHALRARRLFPTSTVARDLAAPCD